VKRIYLDQNKWIDLASAAMGAEKGQRYRDVLTLIAAGVERGYVSCPLSAIHYVETSKRRPYSARLNLAKTMAALSRFGSIAVLTVLLPPEIDRALQRAFGRPLTARHAPIFGEGVGFAMNQSFRKFRVPEDMPVDSEYRRMFNELASWQTEWVMLAGLPEGVSSDEQRFDQMQRAVDESLAAEQERGRQARKAARMHVGERSKTHFKGMALMGWHDELEEALVRAGLTWSSLKELGNEGLSDFLEDIPIIHVSAELQRQREAANVKPWTSNDLNDIFFLMVALVYCDIVVTEKQWVDLARRAGLDAKYNTLLVSDLTDLAVHLV
jgi:hypothetical protein